MDRCQELLGKPFYDRTEILKNKGCCYGCLRIGHQRKLCQNKATCSYCKGRHPSILHVDGRIPPRFEVQNSPTTSDTIVKIGASARVISEMDSHVGAGDPEVAMAIIPVKVRRRGSGRLVETYAFMDPGSNVSFCSDHLMRQLGCEGKSRRLTTDTMGFEHTLDTYEVQNIEVCDVLAKHEVVLPTLYSKEIIPVSRSHIPTMNDIKDYPHLEGVHLPQFDAPIGLLLGNNIPDAYTPLEVRVGPTGTPYASLTRLGWIVWNVIRYSGSSHSICHRADVQVIQTFEESRDLDIVYIKSSPIDCQETTTHEKLEHSTEDKRFMSMSESAKLTGVHCKVHLPFRNTQYLPDDKSVALQILHEKRLSENAQ